MLAPKPTLVLLAAGLLAGATSRADDPAAADRAFAARAAEVGPNAAFLEVLRDDAVLFQPQPVEGRAWMRDHPDEGELVWEPRLQVVSSGDDLGFSSGPWTYGKDGKVLAGGHYLTVWKRDEADGPWRLLADIGITHPAPAAEPSYPALGAPEVPAASEEERAALEQALREAETALAQAAAQGDGAAALLDHAADEFIAMRPGSLPAYGLEAAAQLLERGDAPAKVMLQRLVLSSPADLAVAWGALQELDEKGDPGESVRGWLRVWRREEAGWRALADVRPPAE